MSRSDFADLAEHCRAEAEDYAGRAEEKLLLDVAAAFDELARDKVERTRPRAGD